MQDIIYTETFKELDDIHQAIKDEFFPGVASPDFIFNTADNWFRDRFPARAEVRIKAVSDQQFLDFICKKNLQANSFLYSLSQGKTKVDHLKL